MHKVDYDIEKSLSKWFPLPFRIFENDSDLRIHSLSHFQIGEKSFKISAREWTVNDCLSCASNVLIKLNGMPEICEVETSMTQTIYTLWFCCAIEKVVVIISSSKKKHKKQKNIFTSQICTISKTIFYSVFKLALHSIYHAYSNIMLFVQTLKLLHRIFQIEIPSSAKRMYWKIDAIKCLTLVP